jgi:hypothetical protein
LSFTKNPLKRDHFLFGSKAAYVRAGYGDGRANLNRAVA